MNWQRFETRGLLQTKEAEIGGVRCRTSVSPYDIPLAVSTGYDPHKEEGIIRFQYVLPEDTEEIRLGNEFLLLVGKTSQRIHQITILKAGIGKPQDLIAHLRSFMVRGHQPHYSDRFDLFNKLLQSDAHRSILAEARLDSLTR